MGRGDVKVRKFRYLNRKKVKGDVNTHLDLLNALSTKDLETRAWRQDSPVKIEGSHGAIQGGGDDDMARGGERHSSDPTGVLRESDKAEATEGVPHLDLERGLHGSHEHSQMQTMQPDTGTAAIPGAAWRGLLYPTAPVTSGWRLRGSVTVLTWVNIA